MIFLFSFISTPKYDYGQCIHKMGLGVQQNFMWAGGEVISIPEFLKATPCPLKNLYEYFRIISQSLNQKNVTVMAQEILIMQKITRGSDRAGTVPCGREEVGRAKVPLESY